MDSNLEIFCTCYIPLFLILNKNESHMKLNNIKKKNRCDLYLSANYDKKM